MVSKSPKGRDQAMRKVGLAITTVSVGLGLALGQQSPAAADTQSVTVEVQAYGDVNRAPKEPFLTPWNAQTEVYKLENWSAPYYGLTQTAVTGSGTASPGFRMIFYCMDNTTGNYVSTVSTTGSQAVVSPTVDHYYRFTGNITCPANATPQAFRPAVRFTATNDLGIPTGLYGLTSTQISGAESVGGMPAYRMSTTYSTPTDMTTLNGALPVAGNSTAAATALVPPGTPAKPPVPLSVNYYDSEQDAYSITGSSEPLSNGGILVANSGAQYPNNLSDGGARVYVNVMDDGVSNYSRNAVQVAALQYLDAPLGAQSASMSQLTAGVGMLSQQGQRGVPWTCAEDQEVRFTYRVVTLFGYGKLSTPAPIYTCIFE